MNSIFSLGNLNFGGADDNPVTPEVDSVTNNPDNLNGSETPVLSSIDILDINKIFSYVDSFISLDISKTSTGWVRYRNGIKEEGCYTIKSDVEDLLAQRKEFREFIIDLFQNQTYEYVFIEDTIGSVNYKTSRILQQLNPITDDLMELGMLPQSPIIREGNGTWKKNLCFIANYKPEIKGEDDKTTIRNALQCLGYGDGSIAFVREDIFDAHGLAVGCITRLKLRAEPVKKKKLKTNISQVYKIEQFSDEYEALDRANALDRHIEQVNLLNASRDLNYNFKKHIIETDDDTKVYFITIPTNKIGRIALDKGFNLDYDISYLVVYRKL